MKLNRLLLIAPALLALGLSACGKSSSSDVSSSDSQTSSTESSDSGSSETQEYFIDTPVTIEFWNTFSYATQIENIIAKFKEVEPNVTVVNNKQSGGYDGLKSKVIQGFPTNNYPDLVLAYPDHVAEYLDYNKAVDLQPYMTNADYGWSEADMEDVVSTFLDEGEQYPIPGVYSLPMAKSTEAMYYNEDVLIGLDLSSVDPTINNGDPINATYLNNLTWEELFDKLCPAIAQYNNGLAEADKILKTNEEGYHAIFGYDSDDNLFITLAEQYGYDYTAIDQTTGVGQILFNNDDMKNLMKVFNTAYKNGYIMTKGSAGGNNVNKFFTVQQSLFSVGSTGGVKYQVAEGFNVGVARIPQAAGHDPKIINQGPSVAVLNRGDSNRILATWLFYKFLTNEENSLYWALETGYMPIRNSGYESDDYLDYCSTEGKDPYSLELLTAKNASYVGTVTNYLYTSPVFKGSSSARNAAASVMTQCLTHSNLTDAALNEIFQKAVDDVLLDM